LVVFIVLSIVFSACKPSREKMSGSIKEMEDRIFSPQSFSFDNAKADSLLARYDEFIDRFPKDTLTARYLFMAGQVAMNAGEGKKAIAYFDRFAKDFPGHPKAPMCLFFKGFVYETTLHDMDNARVSYQEFCDKYPSHEFADDARLAIQNLGKSPEQMVREFEERQRQDSARMADSIARTTKHKRS
jgi:outer membrane protein assembly factor BamD (BamD/ComL family)